MSSKLSFSIIIPAYNESKNLENLITEINNFLYSEHNFEIIVIDDCSNDNTQEILTDLKKKYNINIQTHKNNFGQSKAILTGIQNSKYETIVTLDADGQNNPKDISKLLYIYFSNINYKLVGGIRTNRQDSFAKIISSAIANSVRSYYLKDDCSDTGCSLKVFEKNIFLEFPYFNGIHRFLPALFKGYGYKTKFLEVSHRKRIFGESKYGILGRLFKGIIDLIKVKTIISKKINND